MKMHDEYEGVCVSGGQSFHYKQLLFITLSLKIDFKQPIYSHNKRI